MNFKDIRVYNNSQNAAFEELVCQLARQEKNSNYKRFVRNGTPDGGVECFWELENGDEHTWQAKYVFEIDKVINQMKESYDAAFISHPNMTRFVAVIPYDLPDACSKKNGKSIKSARKKWDSKVESWEEEAKRNGRNIVIELWTKSDLVSKVIKPENEGMQYYWFHEKEFTLSWFQKKFEIASADLGMEYRSGKNTGVKIDKIFEYLKCTGTALSEVQELREDFISRGRSYAEKAAAWESNRLSEISRFIDRISEKLQLSGYEAIKLLPLQEILEELETVRALSEGTVKDTAQAEFCNSVGKLKELLKNEGVLLNHPALLLCGDAGSGKVSPLADICRETLEREIPAVFLPGKYFINTDDPRTQIAQLLEMDIKYQELLGALNTIGELKGERILIAIDELDAGKGSQIWPQFLNGMLKELENFPWIAFAASVRSDGADGILPKGYEEWMVKISYPTCTEAVDGHGRNPVSARDKEPVPGLFVINSATVADYRIAIDSSYIKAFLRISSNLKYILYAVCSNATIDCSMENDVLTLSACLQREINGGRQAAFLVGNGGLGKTTTLVQAAVGLCKGGKEIYLFQLGKDNDQQILDEILTRIAQERNTPQNREFVLFIDNPYDNGDGLRYLLNEIQYDTNVQVVIAERLNRFESIAEDVLPDIYFDVARMIVPSFESANRNITKVDAKNILQFKISPEWKREVVRHMFRSIENVDMGEIERITSKQNRMSIIEWYLRTCIEYNKRVDENSTLATRCKVNLDWDEWDKLFITSRLPISEEESRELKNLFQVIAALDIFKIKASIRLLAQKSKIDELRLNHILQSALNTAGGEPAIYEDTDEKPYIVLKHDMVSTLYFEVTKLKPQFILEKLVDIFGDDNETVIRFEKQVFKRKYMQNECGIPFNINVRELYRLFARNKSYYDILIEADRAYSFDLAGVWMRDERSDKNAVSDMWKQLLQNYDSANPKMKRKVYSCCLDDCMRRNVPVPQIFLSTGGDMAALDYSIAQNDLQGIADGWKRVLSELYQKDMAGCFLILEWNKVIINYLIYDFDMPGEFFLILDLVEYQLVDAAYTNLELYVKRNGLERDRYYKLGSELFKEIADRQPTDIPSRMHLANCYEQCRDFRSAEGVYNEILRLDPNQLNANCALGTLYAKWLKEAWKELKDNEAEAERLEWGSESCLKRAIELAKEPVDISRCYGALGWFWYHTKKMYQQSYDAFQTALKYYNQASTNSQMAMLCSNFNKNNTCFSIEEAEYYYEQAILLLHSNSLELLSIYVPYANMLYCLGEYDKAVDMYDKAKQLGEEEASRMLDRIRKERETLEKLRDHSCDIITTFQAAYELASEDKILFKDEQQRNELLSLFLNFQPKGENAYSEVKKAIWIMKKWEQAEVSSKFDIIRGRVIQQIELLAIKYDINIERAKERFRTQCFFIAKDLQECRAKCRLLSQ